MPKHPTGYQSSHSRRLPETIRTNSIGYANQFAGRTTVASGSTSQVVTTTAVKSDSMFRLAVEISSADPVTANSGGFIGVASVVDGTSFALAWSTGVAVSQDVIVTWELVNTT